MKPEAQQIEELKSILEKENGRPFSVEEATEAHRSTETLLRIIVDGIFEEIERKQKLETSPEGFHLDDGRACVICGQPAIKENSWYDKNGIKCMSCQKALNKKLIPVSIINDKDSWYSKYELESYFNIGRVDLNRYVKQGVLKKRVIPLKGKQLHLELYLIRDNKNVLPTKKLLPSKIIKFEKDGEQYYTRVQWFECIDEKGLKKLQKYKIGEILKETFAKPIRSGGF